MTPAPYPSLILRWSVDGVEEQVSALVDSGFEGHLAVPEEVAARLPPPARVQRVQTASGEIVQVRVYVGAVVLMDQPREIEALVIALGEVVDDANVALLRNNAGVAAAIATALAGI